MLRLLRWLLPLALLAAGVVAGIVFWEQRADGARTRVSAELLATATADELYTAFAHVPLLDLDHDFPTRRLPRRLLGRVDSAEVTGYCRREYDVGIGYANARELLTDHRLAVCAGRLEVLPDPTILSLDPVSSQVGGDYTRRDCDGWDEDRGGGRRSLEAIRAELEHEEVWASIATRSRSVLAAFIRVWCPPAEETG